MLPVLFRRDRSVELVDDLVAKGAIHVQVELYFRPGGDIRLALGPAGEAG